MRFTNLSPRRLLNSTKHEEVILNPVNQAQMKEFASKFDLTGYSESDQFELYSIYSVINGGSGENIEPFDAHLTGTEFGLDGVAIVVQGNLVTDADEAIAALSDIKNPSIDFYFFQSKTSSNFDYGEMSKFFDGVKRFFENGISGESDQLSDLIEAKDVIYNIGVKKIILDYSCITARPVHTRIKKIFRAL